MAAKMPTAAPPILVANTGHSLHIHLRKNGEVRDYSDAALKNDVVLHESAWRHVHGKGLSGKQKQKKHGMQFCQESD